MQRWGVEVGRGRVMLSSERRGHPSARTGANLTILLLIGGVLATAGTNTSLMICLITSALYFKQGQITIIDSGVKKK